MPENKVRCLRATFVAFMLIHLSKAHIKYWLWQKSRLQYLSLEAFLRLVLDIGCARQVGVRKIAHLPNACGSNLIRGLILQMSVNNGQSPASFSFIFGLFQTNVNTILQQINVKKCPSSIWHWDSNPRP